MELLSNWGSFSSLQLAMAAMLEPVLCVQTTSIQAKKAWRRTCRPLFAWCGTVLDLDLWRPPCVLLRDLLTTSSQPETHASLHVHGRLTTDLCHIAVWVHDARHARPYDAPKGFQVPILLQSQATKYSRRPSFSYNPIGLLNSIELLNWLIPKPIAAGQRQIVQIHAEFLSSGTIPTS